MSAELYLNFKLYKRIISRLDVKNGILVKGINLEGLRNLGDPEHFSKIYYNQKIDEIHFQDIVASLYNRDVLFKIIEKISKKIFVNVSVGGGIRNINEVDKLLRIGADKVVINTAAVKNPKFLKKLVDVYGSSTISVAIETAKIENKYEVFIETGREKTGIELFKWINDVQKLNVGEIIVTEISMEGRNMGFNLDLYKDLRSRIDTQLVAHGGAGPFSNIADLFNKTNVDAVSIASLFHYNNIKPASLSEYKGSNAFVKFLKDEDVVGTSVKSLKKYLLSKKLKLDYENIIWITKKSYFL